MSKRHEGIGIKQAIRYEWMQKTTDLLLAGLDAESLRRELHAYLFERNGSEGKRSQEARSFAVTNLMKAWVSPSGELVSFRDDALNLLRERPSSALAIHWAMMCAAYPFWFNVARQTGRLLNLQHQVTQQQIISRVKEQYGDREVVSRIGQFVIRSFIAWGVLKDSDKSGRYEKATSMAIQDQSIGVLLAESALLAMPEGKGTLDFVLNIPAFFPFQLPFLTGDSVGQCSSRIEVGRYGLDDLFVKLK